MAIKWEKIYDFNLHGNEPQEVHSVRTIEVNEKRICLARLPEGFFAIDDRCPHAGARLGMGKCDHQGNVICPVHRYRYDVKTGKGLQGDFVNTYPTETRKDGVYIGFKKSWWWPF
jgi:3-phenylpropionate/trans-cinnamate dioxygenase ferredoxin subunit